MGSQLLELRIIRTRTSVYSAVTTATADQKLNYNRNIPPYRRLQQFAIGISVISIVYCTAEGAVSVALGAESYTLSLVFSGIQSGIEVCSALMVLWRFWKVDEERGAVLSSRELRLERISSIVIAYLLLALALATEGTSIFGLIQRKEPNTSDASLIIAASTLVLMLLLWLPKVYLAKALNSSAMHGETLCSLSSLLMMVVLFSGALICKLWEDGWWVDSATSLVLGLFFGWEGWKLRQWARDPEFDGSYCGSEGYQEEDIETGEGPMKLEVRKRDLCDCCAQSEVCRASEECKCPPRSESSSDIACCLPADDAGNKCCTREYVVPKPLVLNCCGEGRDCRDTFIPPPDEDLAITTSAREDQCCPKGKGAIRETASAATQTSATPASNSRNIGIFECACHNGNTSSATTVSSPTAQTAYCEKEADGLRLESSRDVTSPLLSHEVGPSLKNG